MKKPRKEGTRSQGDQHALVLRGITGETGLGGGTVVMKHVALDLVSLHGVTRKLTKTKREATSRSSERGPGVPCMSHGDSRGSMAGLHLDGIAKGENEGGL